MGDEPSRIGEPLARLVRTWGMENPQETAQVFGAWDRLVGPEIAARCRPSSLRSGVLKVRTDSPVWAAEFRFVAPDVVRRINSALGREVVRQVKPWVKASVGENRPMPARPAGRPVAPTSHASARMAQQAAELARGVPDPALADALRRAALAAKKRQVGEAGMVYSEGSREAGNAAARPRSGSPRRLL